jgi:hypothetical protein
VSKVVGEVAIEVGADIGPLIKEMGRAGGVMDGLNRAATRAGRGIESFGRRTTEIGKRVSIASAAVAGLVAGIFALAKSTADAGDAIAKNARQAGVSTDYYQELSYAIGQVTNLSSGELDAALVRLNRTIGEAAEGSKGATEALQKLGFSQSQIASGTITTQQAFDAYVEKMDKVEGSAQAAAISTDLFGKAGAKMGGQLMGSKAAIEGLRDDARSLGLVMSGEATDASEKFGDQVDTLTSRWRAVKNVIGAEVLPLFTDYLLPKLNDVILPAMARVGQYVGEWIKVFNDLPAPVKDAISIAALAIGVGGPLLIAVGAASTAIGDLIAATGPIGKFVAIATLLTAAWQLWGDDFMRIVGGAIDWVTAKFDAFMALLDRIVQKARDVGAAIADALRFDATSAPNTFQEDFGVGGAPENNSNSFGSGGAGGVTGGGAMGAAIVNGAVIGAANAINENRERLAAIFAQIPQIARDTLGIQSPSTVFAAIGRFLGLGMAQGMNESAGVVAEAAKGMAGVAVENVKQGVGGVLTAMGQLFEGSKKISAGIALANSWLAFTEVLKDPAFIGRPWARVAAAFAALKPGLQAVKNINSARPGATGSGGAGAGGGGSGPPPGQANITLVGDNFSRSSVEGIFQQINDGLRQGYRINLVRG